MRSNAMLAYLAFVVLATAVAAAVALVGHFVALGRGGGETALAWRLGCGVCLVASLASGLLVAASRRFNMSGVTVALGSMLLRLVLLVLIGAGVAVALSTEIRPFLLAVAACYLALLVVDTGYALFAAEGPRTGSTGRL